MKLPRFQDEENSETTMTASVLKQDPNTEKVQNNATYWDKTRHAIFRGNPLYHGASERDTEDQWEPVWPSGKALGW